MLPAILAVTGTGLGVYSAFERKKATDKASAQRRTFGLMTAESRREQAALERQEASRRAAIYLQKSSELAATQVGSYTASGILATEGTPLSLLARTREIAEQDYEAIITTGENRATFLEKQAEMDMLGVRASYDISTKAAETELFSALVSSGLSLFNTFAPRS